MVKRILFITILLLNFLPGLEKNNILHAQSGEEEGYLGSDDYGNQYYDAVHYEIDWMAVGDFLHNYFEDQNFQDRQAENEACNEWLQDQFTESEAIWADFYDDAGSSMDLDYTNYLNYLEELANNNSNESTSNLTIEEVNIKFQLQEMEKEDLATKNKDCKGTGRNGRLSFNGILEHVLIEYDYMDNHPGAFAEYQIPGGSLSGHRGYADIANPTTGEMFEIKSDEPSNIIAGQAELAFYIAKAITNCPNVPIWNLGTNYQTRILPWPKDPTKSLRASLVKNAPGIIVYDFVSRGENPVVVPVPIPFAVLDRLKELLRKLSQNPPDLELEVIRYLKANPELRNVLIGTAVGIMIGTIIEDFATAGIGIADDIASFAIAIKIIRIARLIPK